MPGLGVVLYHGIDSGHELMGYARMAEKHGFESLWVTERYFHEETFSMLGYLAAVTTTIRLGVGVCKRVHQKPRPAGHGRGHHRPGQRRQVHAGHGKERRGRYPG